MTDDGFTDPDNGTGSSTPGVYRPGEKVRHGKWGWYDLPNPETGKPALYQRASTIAKIMDDPYHLNLWLQRMTAKGIAIRPDLAALAHSMDVREDRDELNAIVEQAKDAAGARIGANLGTAQHAYAERLDHGEDLTKARLSPATMRDLDAYRDTLSRNGLKVVPALMERVVLSTALGVCGRLDRVLFDESAGVFLIGDLKTGASVDFGGLTFAIQTAIYARADWMWSEEHAAWQRMPEAVNPHMAVIMHAPVGSGKCDLYRVDIDEGYACAMMALEVKAKRKLGKSLIQPWVNDTRFRVAIESATRAEDLSAVWREATDLGMWSKELERLGIKRQRQIQTQVPAPREISA
jgi:hypothetical protein